MGIHRRESGFSLLEIIIVLAIAGVALTFYATYARKEAERTARENVTASLVQEMKGLMTFVMDADAESSLDEGNPLYSNDTTVNKLYHNRINAKSNDKDTGSKNDYFLWGDTDNNINQQRYLFISSKCTSNLKSDYVFAKEYLPCKLNTTAKNSAAMIERVGFYAPADDTGKSEDPLAINRIDVIVAFESDTKKDKLEFANYYPQFSKAMNNAGLIVSRAVVVHRSSSNANWQLVMKKNDVNSPVEFVDIAANISALTAYTSGQFGVRFSFNMSDNDLSGGNGNGNAGNTCWNSTESKVELCYDQETGTGAHGEDKILALNMTNQEDPRGDRLAGTLKANLVMENTARPVFIFKRENGNLLFSADGNPERISYEDSNKNVYEGEFYMDDNTAYRGMDGNYPINYLVPLISDNYPASAYDGFELVTPAVSEYSGVEHQPNDITGKKDYEAVYDDNVISGLHRFAVQTCPKLEQEITLRDANGDALVDDEGKKKTVKIVRALYPRLSASISSISAYNRGGDIDMYATQDKTRRNLSDAKQLDLLGGVTVQVELVEQDSAHGGYAQVNAEQKYIFPDTKYIWAVTATMGMYDSDTGTGYSIENPHSISYVITKWCSTIPQSGTPYDLLTTTEYK